MLKCLIFYDFYWLLIMLLRAPLIYIYISIKVAFPITKSSIRELSMILIYKIFSILLICTEFSSDLI